MIVINKSIGLHLGVSFTPTFYKRARRNYELGYYRDVLALIERAEEDDFINGCLITRAMGYKAGWSISPAGESSKDKDIANFVSEVFNNLPLFDLFQDIDDAQLKEYSVIDLTWDIVNGKQVIADFKKIDQKYFRIDPADNTIKVDWGNRLVPLPDDSAFVVRSRRRMIMLSVLKPYIRKEFGEESWASFVEMFGEPIITAKYPPGLGDKEKADLKDGINDMGAGGRFTVPLGTELEIKETARTTGDHKDFKQGTKDGIAFVLLGHEKAAGVDATMQIGENTAAYKAVRSRAKLNMGFIEEKIAGLIKILVNRNFQNVTAYPYLNIDRTDPLSVSEKIQAATFALNAGAEIEPYFVEELGIPLVDKTKPLKHDKLFPGDTLI
jgi:phage gp29-like protein